VLVIVFKTIDNDPPAQLLSASSRETGLQLTRMLKSIGGSCLQSHEPVSLLCVGGAGKVEHDWGNQDRISAMNAMPE